MGLGPQRKDSKTFGTTVYGLTHPRGGLLVKDKRVPGRGGEILSKYIIYLGRI